MRISCHHLLEVAAAAIFLVLPDSSESVKVFRNLLDVSAPEPMVGEASIRNADPDVDIKDMTLCLRYYYYT